MILDRVDDMNPVTKQSLWRETVLHVLQLSLVSEWKECTIFFFKTLVKFIDAGTVNGLHFYCAFRPCWPLKVQCTASHIHPTASLFNTQSNFYADSMSAPRAKWGSLSLWNTPSHVGWRNHLMFWVVDDRFPSADEADDFIEVHQKEHESLKNKGRRKACFHSSDCLNLCAAKMSPGKLWRMQMTQQPIFWPHTVKLIKTVCLPKAAAFL